MDILFSIATLSLLGTPLLVSVAGFVGLKNRPIQMRKLSFAGACVSLLSALVVFAGVLEAGSIDRTLGIVGDPNLFHFSVGVWIDRLSVLSVILITSIGLVVQKYSVRYLDGDRKQGEFFTWLSFVLFAVTLFVVSRNLLGLSFSWFLVGMGVHRLLLHFSDREAAQKAAWRKFVISRIGDLSLVIALVLTYSVFGTFELREIFEIARTHGAWDPIHILGLSLNPCALVGSLYVIGAMTKSAQFPFHIWLPETMETPTPVSALMHAGIINAGGFLIVRLSPIVAHASLALHILFLVGALTALFGGLIYLVQTDVKRSLAYSTISQMGYMMMQCGLGAFAAAVLHLIMHGYYKAHAFLSAAGRIDLSPMSFNGSKEETSQPLTSKISAAVVSLILLVVSTLILNIDVTQKPGGIFLCLFLWLSSTQALSPVLKKSTRVLPVLLMASLALGGMVIYWILLGQITTFLVPVLGPDAGPSIPTELSPYLVGSVAVLFVALFGLVELARVSSNREWAKRFYVLCLNHFYVEHTWRKGVSKTLGKIKLMPSFETEAVSKDVVTYH
jgi:NAD(P)H-quinone oxidoreductase subunit 5